MRAYRNVIAGSLLSLLVGVALWLYLSPRTGADLHATSDHDVVPSSAAKSSPSVSVRPTPNTEISLDVRSIVSCHDALLTKEAAENRVGCDKIPAGDEGALSFCRSLQAKMVLQAQQAAADAASCPADLAKASVYYEAMRKLAIQGDIPAQRCFIQGYFGTAWGAGEASLLLDEQLNEYPSLAMKFIDDAFARGDWSVVRWLSRLRLEVNDGLLAHAHPIGVDHLETGYRMNYLLLLGNQPDGRKQDEPRRLIDFWKTHQKLTSQQIEQAEAWAHKMYDQRFNGSQEGASISDMNFCEQR